MLLTRAAACRPLTAWPGTDAGEDTSSRAAPTSKQRARRHRLEQRRRRLAVRALPAGTRRSRWCRSPGAAPAQADAARSSQPKPIRRSTCSSTCPARGQDQARNSTVATDGTWAVSPTGGRHRAPSSSPVGGRPGRAAPAVRPEGVQLQRQVATPQLAGAVGVLEPNRSQLLEDHREIVEHEVGAHRSSRLRPRQSSAANALARSVIRYSSADGMNVPARFPVTRGHRPRPRRAGTRRRQPTNRRPGRGRSRPGDVLP